jgi:hemerythrin-like metal-binding protein
MAISAQSAADHFGLSVSGMYSLLPSMQTGISHVDSEHRDLVVAINHIEAAAESGDISTVLTHLDAFQQKLAGHFSNEEKSLREMQYPACDSHANHHSEVIASIDQLKRGVSEGSVELEQIAPQCFTDLLGAVVTMDMRFLNWLEDRRMWARTSDGEPSSASRSTT